MPFVSKAQARACYAQRSRNPNSTWDCDEWAAKTNWNNLPERVGDRKRKSSTKKRTKKSPKKKKKTRSKKKKRSKR